MAKKFWKKNITYEEVFELIEFWRDNFPLKLREIPERLSHKIKPEDINYLQGPYRERGGKITQRGLQELRDIIEAKIDEIKKEESNRKWQRDQIKWTKTLAIATIIALVVSICVAYQSNKLSERVIDITPSKYAYIDFLLTFYFGNTNYNSLTDVESNGYVEVGINIINTGQLNTGGIQISKRDQYNKDNTFSLFPFEIKDIESQSNNISKLRFDLDDSSNIVGMHKISLSIYCPNCREQDKVRNPEIINICVYDDTIGRNYSKAVEEDCNIS